MATKNLKPGTLNENSDLKFTCIFFKACDCFFIFS